MLDLEVDNLVERKFQLQVADLVVVLVVVVLVVVLVVVVLLQRFRNGSIFHF